MTEDEGHTFEVTVRMRGSNSEEWFEFDAQTIRAWSLASALGQALALPFYAWMPPDEEDLG